MDCELPLCFIALIDRSAFRLASFYSHFLSQHCKNSKLSGDSDPGASCLIAFTAAMAPAVQQKQRSLLKAAMGAGATAMVAAPLFVAPSMPGRVGTSQTTQALMQQPQQSAQAGNGGIAGTAGMMLAGAAVASVGHAKCRSKKVRAPRMAKVSMAAAKVSQLCLGSTSSYWDVFLKSWH